MTRHRKTPPPSQEAVILEVMEILNDSAVTVTVLQGREITAALCKRWPQIIDPGKPRAPWTPWTDEERQTALDMHKRGVATAEIAATLGRPHRSVTSFLGRVETP